MESSVDFYSSKPNIKLEVTDKLILLENDFLTVDLNEFRGRVNLVITSPPYNVGINYGIHHDSLTYDEYLAFTRLWLAKVLDLLADDGRLCLNVPLDKNKNGPRPVYADILRVALEVGFKYQSTIIWNEQNISRRTAWGSWMSASAPYVIAPVETIIVLYKNSWKRRKKGKSTVTRNEFIEWTNGVWTFSGANRKLIGHPAPFPVELPRRCIRLFSFEEDIILDPFVGSGTTLVASLMENRYGIGVEIDPEYVKLAVQRLRDCLSDQLRFEF